MDQFISNSTLQRVAGLIIESVGRLHVIGRRGVIITTATSLRSTESEF